MTTLYAKLKDNPTVKLDGEHAVLWINRDRAQSASIAKAPGFVE